MLSVSPTSSIRTKFRSLALSKDFTGGGGGGIVEFDELGEYCCFVEHNQLHLCCKSMNVNSVLDSSSTAATSVRWNRLSTFEFTTIDNSEVNDTLLSSLLCLVNNVFFFKIVSHLFVLSFVVLFIETSI